MSYREENGQVVLTMSREDYLQVLNVIAAATVHAAHGGKGVPSVNDLFGLVNRLNEGNPNYTPYQVEKS